MNRITVVAAVIRRNGKVLLARRPANKPPAGLEFPGGKVEPGETLRQALRRELREELLLDLPVSEPIFFQKNGNIDLWFMRVTATEELYPEPQEGQQVRWAEVKPEPPEGLLPADSEFWRFLAGDE